MNKITVGIDVSRDVLDVAVYPSGQAFVVDRDHDGFRQLCDRLGKIKPVLKTFFDRLVDAGKPRMVAVIAVARKLLTILNAMVRDGIPWQGTMTAAS